MLALQSENALPAGVTVGEEVESETATQVESTRIRVPCHQQWDPRQRYEEVRLGDESLAKLQRFVEERQVARDRWSAAQQGALLRAEGERDLAAAASHYGMSPESFQSAVHSLEGDKEEGGAQPVGQMARVPGTLPQQMRASLEMGVDPRAMELSPAEEDQQAEALVLEPWLQKLDAVLDALNIQGRRDLLGPTSQGKVSCHHTLVNMHMPLLVGTEV